MNRKRRERPLQEKRARPFGPSTRLRVVPSIVEGLRTRGLLPDDPKPIERIVAPGK
jgi:hypothetical protein